MPICWTVNDNNKTYTANIRVEVIDRVGILKDVLAKIADNKTNVSLMHQVRKSKNNKFAIIDIGLEISRY